IVSRREPAGLCHRTSGCSVEVQRPLNNALVYQGFRRLLNKRCVIAERELTLDVQHEDAKCQRLRPVTGRP
ncbi:MAG TPA: hypothetical protein VNZ53_33035, partial [Steroidobacteraceae bacterium]|nr:hypothetical protein [Steroidobacteraceae bacterium]